MYEILFRLCKADKIKYRPEHDEWSDEERAFPALVNKIVGGGNGKHKKYQGSHYPPFYGEGEIDERQGEAHYHYYAHHYGSWHQHPLEYLVH